MTVPLDSMVGELNIVGGARQAVTPATGVFTAPRRSARGRDEDTLYVLIDLGNKAPGMLVDEMKQQLAKAYWSTAGSVTLALRSAVSSVGEWLMNQNSEAAVPDRLFGGISCAVLRHSEIFIAQAGLSNLYVAHQGAIEQFPANDAEPLPPIGMSRSVEVRFAHADLQPGDVLLLTDVRSSKTMPVAAVASAIVYVGVETALQNLEKLAGSGDFLALVVETVPTREAAEAVQATSSAAATASAVRASAQNTAAATTPPAVRSSSTVSSAPPSSRPAETITPNVPAANPLNSIGKSIENGFKRSLVALGTLIQRSLPGPASTTKSKSTSALDNNPKLMAGIAIGIAILTGLFVSVMFIQNRTQAELQSYEGEAQNEITLAMQASGAAARGHWASALDRAQQAIHLRPNDQTALSLLNQSQTQLDKIDNVARVTPALLYDFKTSGQLRLTLHNFSIFVLNRGNSTVQRVTLNANADGIEGGKPAPVYEAGQSIDNKLPGDLLDMAWVNATTVQLNSSLMILHRTGLLQYDLTFGFKSLALGTTPVPEDARRLRAFDGNLYLLDPASQQVWRYRANNSLYADAAEKYFDQPSVDAAHAIDLAIDGNVYLLSADGHITKYDQGKAATFNVTGLAEPIGAASLIAVDSEASNTAIYIVDQSSARIVQLRPDGQFVRQFRATDDAFNSISDLAVDERNGHLYVASAGKLYGVVIPPVGGQ